ncbi:MAG: GAF domain-containing protein [Myxococcota bacterium]
MSRSTPQDPAPLSGAAPPPEATSDRVAELEQELAQAKRKLEGIEDISRALGSEHNLDRILDTVMEKTTELLDADRSTLFILEESTGVLWSRATVGGEIETLEVPLGRGIAGWVAVKGRSVNVKNAYKDPRFELTWDELTGYRTRSILCAPLRDPQQKILGVIQVLNKRHGYFTPADEDLLAAIASQAAIGIHNSRLYLDIVGKNIDLLETSMRLEARTSDLELLFRVERAAATASTREGAIEGILSTTVGEFPCEAAAVVLVDEKQDRLYVAGAEGEAAERLSDPRGRFAEALCGRVLQSGQPFRHPANGGADPRTDEILATADDWRVDHVVCVPIVHQERRLGGLMLVNRRDHHPRGFEEQDGRVLGAIARRLGLALALARAQEEEQKAERLAAIGQMLSGVLHDLKTPLTIISGYARRMAREDGAAERQQAREHIKRQIALVKEMTREMLAYARGETEVLLRKVFVNDFLGGLKPLLEEEFAGTGIELVVDDRYGDAVRMDANKMRRALYNLARNAREAMRDGGTFRVEVDAADDDVVFRFSDDGPGIPEEMEGRLFDPFVTYGKKTGTGLGLAIVKKIVDEHSGRIDVDSTPGEGTTFTIRIPRQS